MGAVPLWVVWEYAIKLGRAESNRGCLPFLFNCLLTGNLAFRFRGCKNPSLVDFDPALSKSQKLPPNRGGSPYGGLPRNKHFAARTLARKGTVLEYTGDSLLALLLKSDRQN